VYGKTVKAQTVGSLPLSLEVKMLTPLKEQYQNEIVPALMKEFEFKSVMQVPRLTKVVVNIGLGEALDNAKAIEFATNDLIAITGQRPVITKAKKSIASFKLREGRSIGAKVTLRGERMWSFLTRLIHVALPRTRDFQGISPDSFDGRGNYTLGLREQLIFPEIDYDSIDKIRGMEVTIVTTAQTDEEGRRLLAKLGMPFRQD
jgi:large subunit ribosomal protein L5